MQYSLITLPKVTHKAGYVNRWPSPPGGSKALALASLIEAHHGLTLILCNTSAEVFSLASELAIFVKPNTEVFTFPDWETLPYDTFSAHESIISDRLKALNKLANSPKGVLITALSSASSRLSNRHWVQASVLEIGVGSRFDLTAARTTFEQAGYRCVTKVLEHGDFAVRGALLDLWPMGLDSPIRLDFFDDEIESIRTFDPETQLSTGELDKLELLPAHEFPTDEQAITRFRQNFRHEFEIELKDCDLYQDVSNGLLPAGIEYYLPLFNESVGSLFDFLDENSLIVHDGNIAEEKAQQWKSLCDRYEQYRGDRTRPILEPEKIALGDAEFHQYLNRYSRVAIGKSNEKIKGFASVSEIPDVTINHKAKDPLINFRQFAGKQPVPLVICCESAGRREAVIELFQRNKITLHNVNDWRDAIGQSDLFVTIAPLEKGFSLPTLTLVSESELFGQQVMQRRRRDKRGVSADAAIHSLAELTIGDPVVHIDHGVGRYLGLININANNQPAEYLMLEYAGSDKLYVPVHQLHAIHRYSGAADAPLHKLGNEQWVKERKKAAEKVRDVAAELLDLYAKRAARPGHKYQTEQTDYYQFAASFPFELTNDQEDSINAILKDMAGPNPMDRLVCGDVGFGKTEVAMRAAFVAVNNNRQVAVLVPTTLLAQQHFENFSDRFADWPVKVEVLSRFRTAKETQNVINAIEDGKVDIVIGTHKLIQDKIKFKNLGLVVIDEEHRFGVRQKEKLKALRSEVDILTLTATPIPRTLNMSLSGMRDLSIIATPPARRLAIKTFVREQNKALVREAIQRETMRGGQVYLLHNAVESIERRARELQELLPDLKIAVAHGQMRERELEDVMQQFYHRRFHVLVCTTIIETGIDVPNANTIIMDRADKLGLAQLHQLRGRVGRSHHQAYAYLMVPSLKTITRDAKKRLDAISNLEDLGAGFSLATHDMEIRGAGEILGEDQSGQMESIGFSMYMEMLEQAVTALKEGREPALIDSQSQETEVDLGIPALIPEDYIPDVHTRLTLYKRLSNCRNDKDLNEFQVELIDRFGLLPDNFKNLITLTSIKRPLKNLGVDKLTATDTSINLDFDPQAVSNPEAIIKLIQTEPNRYQLIKGTRLKVMVEMPTPTHRWQEVESLIETLSPAR